MRPRVGHIKFLNCFPLYYGLVRNMSVLDMDLVPGTPTELNRLMIEEKLDISPISSIEYFRHKDALLLFPDLTVSSSGHVRSIILFSNVPISELDGEKIALTNTSSTSQVLLRIILKYRYGIQSEYFSCQPDLDLMLTKAKAALMIGDKALEESLKNNGNGLYYYDLGKEWQNLSGQKMVYALWCVRKSFAEKNEKLTRQVLDALVESSRYSRDNLKEIVTRASKWERFSSDYIEKYLTSLRFSFDSDEREGLLTFSKMAKESGWLDQNGKLEFFR